MPDTLREWLLYAERRFSRARLAFGHGAHNARDEAVWLLVHVLGIPFEALERSLDIPLDARQRREASALIEQRIAMRKPLAYLLHEAWLRGQRFYVDERVIVPRSFISELMPGALAPWLPRRITNILDLCTGSGCLAILAAQSYPGARVVATDISSGALAVARRNIAAHRLRSRITVARGDLFETGLRRRYELIISNPPYVDSPAMKRLPPEYRYEPSLALLAGQRGLAVVKRILAEAAGHLSPRGALVVEVAHRRRLLERALPRVAFTWLETSAGDGHVFVVTREQLAA